MNSIGVSHIHGTAIGAASSERVIDACVHPIGNGQYKMWYKDENHDSYTYIAISNDLYHWDVCGKKLTIIVMKGLMYLNWAAKNG